MGQFFLLLINLLHQINKICRNFIKELYDKTEREIYGMVLKDKINNSNKKDKRFKGHRDLFSAGRIRIKRKGKKKSQNKQEVDIDQPKNFLKISKSKVLLKQYQDRNLKITKQLTLSKPQKLMLKKIHKTFRRKKHKQLSQFNFQFQNNTMGKDIYSQVEDPSKCDEEVAETTAKTFNSRFTRRFKSSISNRFRKDSAFCMSPIERKALQSPSPKRDFDVQRNNLK